MGKSVGCVLIFRKGTAEIKKNALDTAGFNVFRQVFRTAFHKPNVGNALRLDFFASGNNHVCVLFNGDKVNIGITARKLGGEASLAATDFQHIGSSAFKPLVKINILLFLCGGSKVPVLNIADKQYIRDCRKSFVKVFLFSHSHINHQI